ncbi:BQ5605_C017g08527 [Microbotryum silenes-dioicae]|uniref:BQ5605_C017g08527 protein n=1 Tax=Microbotryum silenes-dioicae TaxID=796604 RepID=A0A2X0LUY1_9BASI|nr:BQ5605_C017g08527 [Microbotryum silenes-dioicae]
MMSNESSLTTNTNATGEADDVLQSALKSGKVYKNCKDPTSFALTFDDGPYKFGAEIAAYLNKQEIKATFFVNGYNYGCIYDYADELIARHKAGHIIASHTWNHADLTTLTEKQIHQEIDLAEEALWKILGIKPALFRAPYGNLNDLATKIITSRGYTLVNWAFGSGDSIGAKASKSIQDYGALLKDKGPIALNHETYASTAEKVIPKVVPMLLKKGYKFVTVDECLGVEPYQKVDSGKGTNTLGGLEDEDTQNESLDSQQEETQQRSARHNQKAHPRHHKQPRDKKGHKSNKGHKGHKHHKEDRHHSHHKGHRDSQHEAGYSSAPKAGFQGTPGKKDKTWTCANTPAPGSM